MRDAKVSIMTHAFMYGTATFEGIRGYWNADQQQLYVLFAREHAERIRNSAKMLLMEDLPSTDELVGIILETVRRNGLHRGRVHPALRSTRARRRSASGSTTSSTSCTSSRRRSGTTSTPRRASG